MFLARPALSPLLAVVSLMTCGCQFVPKPQFDAAASRVRALQRENDALLVELDRVKAHGRELGDRLQQAEISLAELDEQMRRDRSHLTNLNRERQRFASFVGTPEAVPADMSGRLRDLAHEYRRLRYDPITGLAKLEDDVLFDTGEAELSPAGQQVLTEFASLMQDPRNRDLKILVAGHTDDRRIKGRDIRERYPTNWHLSAARSLEVIDYLRFRGVNEDRIALAGYGAYQPVTPNDTDEHRRLNRRVEILVTAPDARIVGWPETVPTLY